jgi:hypothetical protein
VWDPKHRVLTGLVFAIVGISCDPPALHLYKWAHEKDSGGVHKDYAWSGPSIDRSTRLCAYYAAHPSEFRTAKAREWHLEERTRLDCSEACARRPAELSETDWFRDCQLGHNDADLPPDTEASLLLNLVDYCTVRVRGNKSTVAPDCEVLFKRRLLPEVRTYLLDQCKQFPESHAREYILFNDANDGDARCGVLLTWAKRDTTSTAADIREVEDAYAATQASITAQRAKEAEKDRREAEAWEAGREAREARKAEEAREQAEHDREDEERKEQEAIALQDAQRQATINAQRDAAAVNAPLARARQQIGQIAGQPATPSTQPSSVNAGRTDDAKSTDAARRVADARAAADEAAAKRAADKQRVLDEWRRALDACLTASDTAVGFRYPFDAAIFQRSETALSQCKAWDTCKANVVAALPDVDKVGTEIGEIEDHALALAAPRSCALAQNEDPWGDVCRPDYLGGHGQYVRDVAFSCSLTQKNCADAIRRASPVVLCANRVAHCNFTVERERLRQDDCSRRYPKPD